MLFNLQNLNSLGLTNSSLLGQGCNYDSMSMNGSLFGFGFGNGCSYFTEEDGTTNFDKVGVFNGVTTFVNVFAGSLQPEMSALLGKITAKIDAKQGANAFNKNLNSVDGNAFNRLNNKKYEDLFENDGNLKENAEVDEAALRKAFAKYRKASPKDRPYIAKQLVELWDNAPEKIKTPQYTTLYNHIAQQL